MLDFFSRLFDTADFPPRWFCGQWSDSLGWLHIVSDISIFGAYFSIPCVIVYFVLKRQDVAFYRIYWLFGAFIFWCGVTHLIEASIFWYPWYRLSGLAKLVTAVVSWMSVVALVGVLPKALSYPSLEAQNRRLQAETDARAKADQLFRLAIQSAPNGVLMIDSQGTIVLANKSVGNIFGYDPADLVGRKLDVLLSESVAEYHPRLVQQYFENPTARPMGANRDLIGINRTGREVPVEIGLTPIHSEEGVRVMATIVDVTERKRLEQHLREHTKEMEEVLYVVSHDMRSPLVTIQGFANLAQKDIAAGDIDEGLSHLRRVERASKTLATLIEGLLDFCHADRTEQQVTELDMEQVLEEVINSLQHKIEDCQARIQIHRPLPRLRADSTKVIQLFLNLIGNALKYGCHDADSVIEVSGQEQRNCIVYYVRDHGPGIPEQHREKVFKLFQRLDKAQDGSGLGLATVAKIMHRQGGKVWIEDTPRGGATLALQFPKDETYSD